MESKALFRTYGIDDRGARFQLAEGVHLKFSDGPQKPHMCRICIQNDDGSPNEKGLEKVRLLEKSNGYQKGRIYYIPSPAELRAEQRRKEQEAEAQKHRENLSLGLYELALEDKDVEYLREFADSIGAKVESDSGKLLAKPFLLNGIYGVLGVSPPARGARAAAKKRKEKEAKDEVK